MSIATATPAAATTARQIAAAWGSIRTSPAGEGGLYVEHRSRPEGSGAVIWRRWHIASNGKAYPMALEPGDPRFQGLSPVD